MIKNTIVISLLSIAISSIVSSATINEKVAAAMVKLMPLDEEWTFRSDRHLIVASLAKVRLLNPISLPVYLSDEEIWKKYSIESDFNIIVKLTSRLSSEEYNELVKLRVKLIETRVREFELETGEKMNGKSRFGIVNNVNTMIPLPYCFSEYKSIWIKASNLGFLKTKPKEVGGFTTDLKAYFAKEYTLYKKVSSKGGK